MSQAVTVAMPRGRDIERLVLQVLPTPGSRAHRLTIMSSVRSLGGFTAEQVAVPPPATNQGRFTSRIDYLTSIALSNLKRKGHLDNIGDGKWMRVNDDEHG